MRLRFRRRKQPVTGRGAVTVTLDLVGGVTPVVYPYGKNGFGEAEGKMVHRWLKAYTESVTRSRTPGGMG